MDWLLAVEPTLARNVQDCVADLLNLEVDLLFFDTTSTHFQIEQADEALPRGRDRTADRGLWRRRIRGRFPHVEEVEGSS